MTDEEKEIKEILDCDNCKFATCEGCEINYTHKKMISNYIIRQQKEIEEQKQVIDMMAELIARKTGARIEICHNMNCNKEIAIECKSCAKQYFINKVKENK